MESLEEIESFYEKEIENLDKEFLEESKKTKDRKPLEKDYREKLNDLKKQYEKKYKKHLEEQKKIILKKEEERRNKKGKKKKEETFKVEKLDLELTRREKFKLKWEPFKFRLKIKLKNLQHSLTPDFLLIFYIKIKLKIKKTLNFIKNLIAKIISKIIEIFFGLLSLIKKISVKTYFKTKKIISFLSIKIVNLYKKKKLESKEKRPDEKIAEKLIKK